MTAAPFFSVVVPAYNRAALLPATLESVFAQRYTRYELIVVDDGSTDATPGYLRTLGGRVKAIRQDNAGPGAARNRGIEVARGDYVAFLDSDDLWFPWTLGTLAATIAAHGSPAIAAASTVDFADEAGLATVREEPLEAEAFADFLSASSRSLSVGSGMATIRRDVLGACGGFTPRPINCEDHDLMLRLGAAGRFVQVARPALLAWRRHPGSVSRDLERLVAGCRYLIEQERAGAYPGGEARRHARREVIARHVRPVSLECLRQGRIADGRALYARTIGWNLGLNRWRYLVGFPAHLAGRAMAAPWSRR